MLREEDKMADIFHSLDEVFADAEIQKIFQERHEENKPKRKIYSNPDIETVIEINEWFEEHGAEPTKADVGSDERRLYNRLIGLREDRGGDRKEALASYDRHHLLTKKLTNDPEEKMVPEIPDSFDSLDDALSGLGELFEADDAYKELSTKIFDTSSVKKPIKTPSQVGTRIAAENFAEYEPIFKKVQREIANGQRQVIKFKNYDIKAGRFYILKGLLAYIEAIGEEFQGSDNKPNARMRVIFENGTESQMLRRAFGASMYSRGGKIVTEVEDGKLDLKNDILSGSIYVLKSLSNNPDISNIKNLYKIGYTSESVKKRVSNARNEDTYLYAPVEIIRDYQIMNVDAHKFETVLHHILADSQLQVEIEAPNGTLIKPREWFVLTLDEIDDAINRIIVEMQK